MGNDRKPKSEAHVAYGRRLREAREAVPRLSQPKLADKLGHSAKTIYRCEAGISVPDKDTVAGWEKACGLPDGALRDDLFDALTADPWDTKLAREHATEWIDLLPPTAPPEADASEHIPSDSDSDSRGPSGDREGPLSDELDRVEPSARSHRAREYLIALALFVACLGFGVAAMTMLISEHQARPAAVVEAERYVDDVRVLGARLDRVRVDARDGLAKAGPKAQAKAADELSRAYADGARANREVAPPARVSSEHVELGQALLRARDAYHALSVALQRNSATAFRHARTRVRQAEEALEIVLAVLGSARLSD